MEEQFAFSFEATPGLGPAALRCVLWKRAGFVGPVAILLLPALLLILAAEDALRTALNVVAGAALMLFTIVLAAVWQRRRMRQQFFKEAPNRVVHVVMDEAGILVSTALGQSRLSWAMIERVWHCKTVALLFYHGWQYVALPISSLPEGALEYAQAHCRESRTRRA